MGRVSGSQHFGRASLLAAIAWGWLTSVALAVAVVYEPPNRGAPGRSGTVRDAGSRGCGMIVLEPTQTHWGETLQPQPTFWVYVSAAERTLQVTLTRESTQEVLYQMTYDPIPQAGVSYLPASDSMPELLPDEPYRWQITVDCPDEGVDAPYATGIVVRRSPSAALTQQLTAAAPEARVALLASQGLWYDALTELGQLRLAAPASPALLEAWASLLEHESVQLHDVVDLPLTHCCSPGEDSLPVE